MSESKYTFVETMIAFADHPVKALIAKNADMDISDMWGSQIMLDTGYIILDNATTGNKYRVSLSVVPCNYMLDLGELDGDPKALEAMSYLIHCAQSLYSSMVGKNKHCKRSMKVDINSSTWYFHSADQYRLGIVIALVDNGICGS